MRAATRDKRGNVWLAAGFQVIFLVLGVGAAMELALRPGAAFVWAEFWVGLGLAAVVTLAGLGFPSPRGTFTLEWVCVLLVLQGMGAGPAAVVAAVAMGIRHVKQRRREGIELSLGFDLAVAVLAVYGGAAAMTLLDQRLVPGGAAASLPVAALGIFVCLELPRASALALATGRRLLLVWREQALWAAPYHLAGAGIAGLFMAFAWMPPWTVAGLGVLLIVLLSRAFQAQLGGMEKARKEAEELTALQTGMLEALALAVEARESGGRPHLHRMRRTALALGERMGLPPNELKALEIAAMLHDMGKMAVPDYILTKPGRLQPHEFERLKLHPVVAAEIVERARFPYPVAPMIRAHHERWDGGGYPDGLRGEVIPRGGRILAVVDTLDALMSERKYRRGLPLAKAVEVITRESGTAYDPRVVEALGEIQAEIERFVHAGDAPGHGDGFLAVVTEAHREEHEVQDLLEQLNVSFDREQVLPVVEQRLQRVVPHETVVVWVAGESGLRATQVLGRREAEFRGGALALGEGATGKAALRRAPLVNVPASEEYQRVLGSAARKAGHTAVAVPFVTEQGVTGVLTAYGPGEPGFEGRHARLLAAFAPRFVSWLESANRYRKAEQQASQDGLTGLPNSSALFLHLQQEIERNTRENKRVAVLVCDLDGFKGVNDTHGHLAGNQVLQAVAAGLRERCRGYDFVARMGGDEFVIVLPGLGDEAIEDRLESFRTAVREAGRKVCGHPAVALSIGVAISPADGTTPDDLLAKGDERMYANKRMRKLGLRGTPDTAHAMYLPPEA